MYCRFIKESTGVDGSSEVVNSFLVALVTSGYFA
jgi:hypothetical protein